MITIDSVIAELKRQAKDHAFAERALKIILAQQKVLDLIQKQKRKQGT